MVDLKELLKGKISNINDFSTAILRAFNLTRCNNVTDLVEIKTHSLGDKLSTGLTNWVVVKDFTPFKTKNGYYLKAIGDVFVEDFNDDKLSQSEYVTLAHQYCMSPLTKNRLIFNSSIDYQFDADTSFEIFVESGGWYSTGICNLKWKKSPSRGFAVKITGRYNYEHNYSRKVNDSNYCPLEGFNIGAYHSKREGCGLQIGHSDSINSMNGAKVTSKFMVKRVSVFDFDDVISFFPGVWACELYQFNTMGGSWNTPFYFNGIDFGESIKITNCCIADNHKRIIDNKLGTVNFNTGEFIVSSSSFDNMRVIVNGDANVKMFAPHFENPTSIATNKRFLEVNGDHAYCVLDSPQIVIRDTPIYSNLFYCKAGTKKNKHPWSAGLVLKSPSYQSRGQYRPDLAVFNEGVFSAVNKYESDGYLELVGGGGRVYLSGGVHINSLYYTYNPIPIARNLVGASLANHSFDIISAGNNIKFWRIDSNGWDTSITDEDAWIGDSSLQMTANNEQLLNEIETRASQSISCAHGQLCLGSIKCKWNVSGQFISKGQIVASLIFIDSQQNVIEVGSIKKVNLIGSKSESDYKNWIHLTLFAHAPPGCAQVNIVLKALSNSKNGMHSNITVYWDAAIFNVL